MESTKVLKVLKVLKLICRLEMDFSLDAQFKHVLPHIYIQMIKFDLSNYQMFSWLSGVAQGVVIKERTFRTLFFVFKLVIMKVM